MTPLPQPLLLACEQAPGHGVRLITTVYSYASTLFVGLIAGRRALPHLHDLKLCLDEVWDEFRRSLNPG